MQRTDQAERFLELMASVPLTWENVFRSPQYTVKSGKEVVDLLLVLRNKGIFISLKCQQDPQTRTGHSLVRWVQKSSSTALRQVGGAIRTSKTREFWCSHQRRGRVYFEPSQIDPVRAIVVVETLEEVSLNRDMPLEIDSVPVSYISLNDSLNVLSEVRTINDLILYLKARDSLCPELQRTMGSEKQFFEFYILYGGSTSTVNSRQNMIEELGKRRAEVARLVKVRQTSNLQARPIEQVSDSLSTRLESYEDGLDEEQARQFDPVANRHNYLLIQDELCDLVLDERRKLGVGLEKVVEKVKEDVSATSMCFQVAYLDSKPDFLYVLSSTKGVSRNEVFKRCGALLQGGLAHYGKIRGLAVNYTQGRDGYDVVMVNAFVESPEARQLGNQLFSHLKMFDTPVEKV